MKRFMFTDGESVSICRNGCVKTIGIEIVKYLNDISIFPISSRKTAAHGCVSIPKCELRLFIENLEEILREYEEEFEIER
jgi:hypothetical protein